MNFEDFRYKYESEYKKLSDKEKEELGMLGYWMIKRTSDLIIEVLMDKNRAN